MNRVSVCAAAVALVFGAPVHAEWYRIGESQNRSVWYMDPARVRSVNGKIQAWVQIDNSKDRTVRSAQTKQLISFDCSALTYKNLTTITYDTYGKILSNYTSPDYGYGIGYDPIVPDSMAETVEKAACSLQSGN